MDGASIWAQYWHLSFKVLFCFVFLYLASKINFNPKANEMSLGKSGQLVWTECGHYKHFSHFLYYSAKNFFAIQRL